MNRLILTAAMIILPTCFALAQGPLAEIVIGRLDDNSAAPLYAFDGSTFKVELWMRTAPGTRITAMHIPLSSNDSYIESRSGGGCSDYYPLNVWEETEFLVPNSDSCNPEFTNQSFIGSCSTAPENCQEFIDTQGMWWKILEFYMISADNHDWYIPFWDAFREGCHSLNGGLVLEDYLNGPLDPSTYTVQYSCLEFVSNICGNYVVGDYNGSGVTNVADVVDMWSRLKTGQPLYPALLCDCPPGVEPWSFMGDVNGSCTLNVADVIFIYYGLHPDGPDLVPCPLCPPGP